MKQIKTSGIPYAIFYASSFMENFLNNQKHGSKISLAGKSRFKMFYISGEDYGRQVANSYKILTTETRDYAVQGLMPYTAEEAANLFVRFYKKEKLKVQKIPFFILRFLGKISHKFLYISKLSEAINNYQEKFQAELTWKELGKPIVTIEEYAARF